MLYEENQKSGNVVQQPMDSYSIPMDFYSLWNKYELSRSLFTFRTINTFLLNSGTPILREKSKGENCLASNLYHKQRNA